MVRTKFTAQRSHEKTCQLPAWIVNIEYGKKKQSLQSKTNITCTKDSEHYQKWNQCKNVINVKRKSKFCSG